MAAVLEEVRAAGDPGQAVAGRSPWALAARQLWRNRLAMASLALFLAIVVACFLAPFYAQHIAHVNAFANNINGTTIINGKKVPLMRGRRRDPAPGCDTDRPDVGPGALLPRR